MATGHHFKYSDFNNVPDNDGFKINHLIIMLSLAIFFSFALLIENISSDKIR